MILKNIFYKPKVGDIVLIKHSDILAEITKVNTSLKDVSVTILRCQVKEREIEKGHLATTKDLKLIWSRK